MAKRKKRRLKKSVKRGCALIIAVPILVFLFFLLKDLNVFSSRDEAKAPAEETEQPADFPEMTQRFERLFHSVQRLDTTHIAIEVRDIATDRLVFERNANRLAPPASCMKLLTAVTAMQLLGIDHQYTTQVITRGEQRGSTFHGIVLLQLDDDPMVESLEPMVDAIRQQGIKKIEGDIELQLARDDTLRAHASAATWDIPYHRLPILLKGRGRIEQDLRFVLQQKGITLSRQSVTDTNLPTRTIYHHQTPLTDVLAPMLINSSNIKADGLFHHIGQNCRQLPCITLSEGDWLLSQAALIDHDHAWQNFVVNDGSGLSPDNRLTAHFLVQLLQYAWFREDMRHVLIDEALASPGHPVRRGSLRGRMSAPMFRNKIFVKTGTLTTIGLSSLAGYAQGADGRWYAFSIINEDSPIAESHIFQDQVCKELVR